MMSKKVSEEDWRNSIFPEWGEWLLEEIEDTKIEAKKVGLWWMGNMGLWLKSDQQTNIAFDLWASTGKQTHRMPDMSERHQFARLTGGRKIQPNLRAQPVLFNPFSIKKLEAYFVTHYHHDHLDQYVAAALTENVPDLIFYGPKYVVDEWLSWGVPENRTQLVQPGDIIKVEDLEVEVVESFDKPILITDPPTNPKTGLDDIPGIDERAVSFLVKTSAGNIYNAGDSLYSPLMAYHGQKYKIDIALLAFGENPIGIEDKMTSVDVLRAAEALKTKVVVPLHWDVWTNTLGDPEEILALWKMRKDRFNYRFIPFHWLPGGKYLYPDDQQRTEYFHERGFEDRYTFKPNVPKGLF